MKRELTVEERLIVAADFKPSIHGLGPFGGIPKTEGKFEELLGDINSTGVIVKTNSLLRAGGYGWIYSTHSHGLKAFADLKLVDIPETMATDAEFLKYAAPEFVTVMCNAGVSGMAALRETLGPKTEVLGVTVLTSLGEAGCHEIYGCSVKDAVLKFADMALQAGLGGLVLSPQELGIVREQPELGMLSLNTPGIRPAWAQVDNDDQKRVMTPKEAIRAGADRIIVGRPIITAPDPRAAIMRTLDEIREGLEARS